VQGAARFVQRVWRMVGEITARAPLVPAAGEPVPTTLGAAAERLRKATHRTLSAVGDNIEGLRFNVAVARIYEFVNAINAEMASAPWDRPDDFDPALGWALREAVEVLVQVLAPMMPHLAEECWAALGHKDLVGEAPWPEVERSLLIENAVTLPVQVNGKKRADVTVARDADQAAIEAAVLSLDAVQRATEGRPVRKIIVVPQRIVNVVA
jgi:leucyl-tRNA synthetase